MLADHDQPTAKEPTSPANPVAYPSCLAYYPANQYWVSDHDYITAILMNPLPGNQLTPLPTSQHWLPNHHPPNPPEDPLPPTAPPDIRCDHHPPMTGASADIGSPIQLGARTPWLTDGYWRLALPGVLSGRVCHDYIWLRLLKYCAYWLIIGDYRPCTVVIIRGNIIIFVV